MNALSLPSSRQVYMLPQTHQPRDRSVSMSNRLARAAQNLNLAEKRLVALGLAFTDSVSNHALQLAANAGWVMRISAASYAEAFKVDTTTAYEQLEAACNNLFERYVTYTTPGRKGPQEHRLRWVSRATYMKGEGCVELNFTPEIAPHLLGLHSHFTTYKLGQASELKFYAWRLFEVLMSWKSTGKYTCTIEEFYELVEAPASCRKDFKGLRVRIIEPSVEAIQRECNLIIKWEPMRSGSRKVTGLSFAFWPDPQRQLDFMADPAEMRQRQAERLAAA